MTVDLYRRIVQIRDEGRRAALATIVRRIGSTPRKDHAKMLIEEDGTSWGSVGGGCVEAEVWQQAFEVIESGRPALIGYEMKDEEAREEGLICGGTVEVFVEPILPDPKIVLMGAGHLGRSIARLAHDLGFQVTVADDREAFANRERFPMAERIVVDRFETSLLDVPVDSNTHILVVTRGHSHDQEALRAAVQTDARYVGLVGSRRKIKIIVEALLDEGLAASAFEKLYAPIGVDIGSETPEEIAVSVMAELIALRKGKHRLSEKQEFVRAILKQRVRPALADRAEI